MGHVERVLATGSITGFKIMYRDENGVWDGVRWDGEHPAFFAFGETDDGTARRSCAGRAHAALGVTAILKAFRSSLQ
jgi:hypothetical protein